MIDWFFFIPPKVQKCRYFCTSSIIANPKARIGDKVKLIAAKPKARTASTSYLIDVDSGTTCTNLIDEGLHQRLQTE